MAKEYTQPQVLSGIHSLTKIKLNAQFFADVAFILFFSQDAIRVVVGTGLSFFPSNWITWIMIFLMYGCLLVGYTKNKNIGSKHFVFDALVLVIVIFLAFAVTYLIHPEYYSWYFEGSYPITRWIFRPNQFIYAYLFVRLIKDPEHGIKLMKIVAYILLAYYTYKLLRALSVGYWITTTTASGAQQASYDLNYGYDHLLVASTFLVSAFRERKFRYIILSGISTLEIFMAGSRGPLLGIAIALILLFYLYKNKLSRILKAVVGISIVALILLWVIMGTSGILIALGLLLSNLGIKSRTITMMIQGNLSEDNNRVWLYELATNMIKNGFWGYGAYGDRYTIGKTFWVGYVHNIFLEMLIDWGWILGGIISVKMVVNTIRVLFINDNANWRDLFIIFLIPCTKLLMSGSFWYLDAFWAAIGVYVSYSKIYHAKLRFTRRRRC